MNKKIRKILIALDDGHGIETPGKRTPPIPELNGRQIKENEFNRAVVKLLDKELKRCGFDTLLVAPTDKDTSLSDRVKLANRKKADLYVSIHYNAYDGTFSGKNPEGFSLHIYFNSPKSRKLAEHIHKYLKGGVYQQVDRGIKESNFYVLRETNMPAVLTENGFMDNKREAMLMINKDFQKEVAEEHARGICEYFNIEYVEGVKEMKREHWAKKHLKSLEKKGIIKNPEKHEKDLNGTFTKAEMIAIVDRITDMIM